MVFSVIGSYHQVMVAANIGGTANIVVGVPETLPNNNLRGGISYLALGFYLATCGF